MKHVRIRTRPRPWSAANSAVVAAAAAMSGFPSVWQSSRAAAGQVRDSDVGHRKPCMTASTARPNDISSVMAKKWSHEPSTRAENSTETAPAADDFW